MLFEITEVKRLLDEVSTLAERDELTGLFNRRSLFIHGVRLFNMLGRAGGTACLLMLDIDFFKTVNDTYGHPTGDIVLRALAELLNSRFRTTDLVSRYGGEEFCVFLPNMPEAMGLEIADRLRRCTEDMVFTSLSDDRTFQITISIGLVVYVPARHLTFDMMISDADVALYAAKNNGRNTIYITKVDPLAEDGIRGITLTRYAE